MDIGFKGNILGDFEAAGGFVKIIEKQYNHPSVGKYTHAALLLFHCSEW